MSGFATGNDFKEQLVLYKDNIGNLSDAQVLSWVNFVNQFMYEKLASVQPEQYLTNSVIKPIINKANYAKPSDFKDQSLGGIFFTFSGSDYLALNFDIQTVAFTKGTVITGSTSGATGYIESVTQYTTSGTLQLSAFTGEFIDDELITDTSGGSARVNGTQFPFSYAPQILPKTNFGSQQLGFWMSLTEIIFTPVPQILFVFVQRYLPRLPKLTALTQETIILTPEYDEFIRDACDVYWTQWRQDALNETFSSARYEAALNDLLTDISDTPDVIDFKNSRNVYRGLWRGAGNNWNDPGWGGWN